MKFSVFVPPQAKSAPCPALYYLAGLTCTHETFTFKAGAQRLASELWTDPGGARYQPARLEPAR